MQYLGNLGRLIPIASPSQQVVSGSDRYVYRSTLEGKVKAHRLPNTRRVWSLSSKLTSGPERGVLDAFARGDWGAGPFVYVPTEAPLGNVLTPEQGSFVVEPVGYVQGGPVLDADGVWQGVSLTTTRTNGAAIAVATQIPCLPGVPVTASVDVARHPSWTVPTLAVRAISGTGTVLATAVKSGASTDAMQRLVATLTPPGGAVSINIDVLYTARIVTRLQVTWTDGPVAYHPPAGCAAAVLDTPSTSLVTAWADAPIYAGVEYTIREVG